ncbi:hypothetical protein Ddye_013658 [Dipteronia dyeriana]|uniref:Protein FAR1-RELATED SEQUENCE n=1 Tax=Dipteronia dyeriana TaxID=168575 RepID=A0AAE0CJT4_9ROSI|nr:hypothetical protein Ddye_013658 [Dipteronia dyeriana]
MFSAGTGHLDLNIEGYLRWHEADTTHINNEELKPTNTYNNFDWPYHVPFVGGYRAKKHVDRTDRVREPRGLTHDGCRAALKINFDRENVMGCYGVCNWVRGEIKSETKLSIVNCVDEIDVVMYTFKKFGGGDTTWTVRFTPFTSSFNCSCKMFDTVGILCCQSFSVIKDMNQHNIPESLIMQWWIKTVKDVSEVESSPTATTPTIIQLARFAS